MEPDSGESVLRRRGIAMASTEAFSEKQLDDSPLLAEEEREEGPSYVGRDLAWPLAELEERLQAMERKCAAFVRHDVYGPMGKGPIPLWEKARLVVALLFLVPMRVFMLSMIVIFFYIVMIICTMFRALDQDGFEEIQGEPIISLYQTESEQNGAEEENDSDGLPGNQENYAHLIGLRRFVIVELGRCLSRVVLFVLGFYWIKVTRRDKKQDHERLLKEGMVLVKSDIQPSAIVSNHVSYIDVLYYMSVAFPSFVAKRSVTKLPVAGLISKCLGCVYVEREDKPLDSRGVAGIIRRRMQASAEDNKAPLMMLFPEGTTTNGYYLLPFKTGAFLAGTPIRPVILKYSYRQFSPAWDTISGASISNLMSHSYQCLLKVHLEDPEVFQPRNRYQNAHTVTYLFHPYCFLLFVRVCESTQSCKASKSLEENSQSLRIKVVRQLKLGAINFL